MLCPAGARAGSPTGPNLLWIADFGGERIVSVATDGTPTNYDVGGQPPGSRGRPGAQIAYSNPGTDPQTVGRISPGGAALTTNTPNADPFGAAFGADGASFGADGAYWFAQFATDDLGRLTPGGA